MYRLRGELGSVGSVLAGFIRPFGWALLAESVVSLLCSGCKAWPAGSLWALLDRILGGCREPKPI